MPPPDISIIVTAHSEGAIAGVTARSALAALSAFAPTGIRHEMIVVLDRADAVTAQVLKAALGEQALYLETDEGDPGAARNKGVEAARGQFATFLDADDLWSENWLVEAWKLMGERPDVVAHSACNVIFGQRRIVWWHTSSEAAMCERGYLSWGNYWDAMSFARTDVYRRFPFRRNNLALGFGHEDWHWNLWTLSEGVSHLPTPRTIHFKRSRRGSQMSKVDAAGAVVWPLNLANESDLLSG